MQALRSISRFYFSSYSRILMPSLSPTMEEGTVREWLKKEKQKVEAGDVLCVVQTDKANVDFEYQDQGYLAKIAVPMDSNPVKVGGVSVRQPQLLGFLVEDQADLDSQNWDQLLKQEQSSSSAPQPAPQLEAPSEKPKMSDSASQPKERVEIPRSLLLSPAARILFARNNLSGQSLTGSGKHGMITKPDIINFLASPPPPSASKAPKKEKAKASSKVEEKKISYQDKTVDQIRINQKLEQTKHRSQYPTSHLTLSLYISQKIPLQDAKQLLQLKLKSIVSSSFFEAPSAFTISVQEQTSPMRPILPVNCDVLATVTQTRIAAVSSNNTYDPFNPDWDIEQEQPSYQPKRALTVNLVVKNLENLSVAKIAEGMHTFKKQMELMA